MDSPKYLIIVTLLEGQNFTVPDGAPERIEATVFAEARFGNESILKSDPIKLTNSFPEFVTELAWQLNKKSLHQLRVERRAIKLQIFLQTKEKKKSDLKQIDDQKALTNGVQVSTKNDVTSPTHKIELIGYTVIDIRSAQERGQQKFQWLPLLNPKFRKSTYNRPEVYVSLTLTRIDDSVSGDELKLAPPTALLTRNRRGISSTAPNEDGTVGSNNITNTKQESSLEYQSESHESDIDSSVDSKLYKTCLDLTLHPNGGEEKDEIIENDINIRFKEGCYYIYDRRDACKSTIDDCDERYKISVSIPFNSDLTKLVVEPKDEYYFSVTLFGSVQKSSHFKELTRVEVAPVEFEVFTTHSSILATYFELNSSLIIKLHTNTGQQLGIATIQLDQLCGLGTTCRSIEGIFSLEPLDEANIPNNTTHPTIGVSVVLKRVDNELVSKQENNLVSKNYFGEDIDEYFNKTLDDTHQLTLDNTTDGQNETRTMITNAVEGEQLQDDDHHFCFTIDLKSFSYTPAQRLIPTLRELVVRYSYPFFGYKDTITTDASIPISPTNSIIVSGFCEFNFATSVDSLVTAMREIPLNLEILTCDEIKKIELDAEYSECVVANSSLNLAQTMNLTEKNLLELGNKSISTTISAPIYEMNGAEVGELQIYLCLKDLGKPTYNMQTPVEEANNLSKLELDLTSTKTPLNIEAQMLDSFISEAKRDLESWKDEYSQKLAAEIKQRENEKFKRLYYRLEAREAKREQEFKKKIEELNNLEKRLKNSLDHIESLERKLSNNFDQMKSKDAILDTRLDTLDLMISKAINNIKLEYEKRQNTAPVPKQKSLDENCLMANSKGSQNSAAAAAAKPLATKPTELNQYRRSSLKNSNTTAGIPISIRSSSQVRSQTQNEGQIVTRLVRKPVGVTATVINGTSSSRLRSNSTRLNLSKETQEKLQSLRREKAELLKRGCRPNDALIQEINLLIEKLAV